MENHGTNQTVLFMFLFARLVLTSDQTHSPEGFTSAKVRKNGNDNRNRMD